MKNLSKEKRNRLIMVVAITVIVLAGLWFGLIGFLQGRLTQLEDRRSAIQGKLDKVQYAVKNAELVENQLGIATNKLTQLEDDMVFGDPYAWMYSKLKAFKAPYKIEIPTLNPPEVKDVNLLPKFPYKQADFVIGGTAYFHDLGKFVADFENHFPLFRVVNLDLSAAPTQVENDKEKLNFKMDIIVLMKPNT
jgi:hypothetical protein